MTGRMIFSRRLWAVLLAAVALSGLAARGDEPAKPADYLREIKPLLARHCTACHGAEKQKSGLRLDSASFATRGGDSGPAVEPGKSGESLLIQAVTGAE